MGFVTRMLGLEWPQLDPDDERVWSPGWAPKSTSGIRVDATQAMTIAAVWAAVLLVSEGTAMLPLHIYRRRSDGGKEDARDHPLEDVLRRPNPWMNGFEFREMMQGHVELRGNAYARILPGRRGPVDQLIPLHPDRVTVDQESDGQLIYRVRQDPGSEQVLLHDEVFHLRGLSSDGLTGLSTIAYARNSMGLTLATEEYGARTFSQSARPSGVLTTTKELSREAFQRLKADWHAAYGGVENSGKTAILEEGMSWQQIGMASDDAQFLESRRFQTEEIARWFRVPPHMIGDLERATFSNIEEQGLQFVVYSLMGRLKRWEQAIARSLIVRDDIYYAEHNVDGLLRGDIKSRYEAYAIARNWGWMNTDEIRARENMNPLPNGEGQVYLQPLNMIPAGADVEATAASIANYLALYSQRPAGQERAERNGHVAR